MSRLLATIDPRERTRCRKYLRERLWLLNGNGPQFAGKAERIKAVLAIESWPPSRERFDEFCGEVLGGAM